MENEKKEKKELSPQEIQRRKKMIVFPLMFLAFAGCMWLIFAPSGKDQEHISGFNSEIPLPTNDGIVDDKIKAYEQEQMREKEKQKIRTLADFGFTVNKEEGNTNEFNSYLDEPEQNKNRNNHSGSSSIESSAAIYQDLNKQLGSFYETPVKAEDEQKQLELEWRLQQLEDKLQKDEISNDLVSDQMALLEKSYEMAAKYMNPSYNQEKKEEEPIINPKKNNVSPVKPLADNIVSSLSVPISNEQFLEEMSQPRNFSFITAVGSPDKLGKNIISARTNKEQKIVNGQPVYLELEEPLMINNIVIPANSELTGIARLRGDRLDININAIGYYQNIIDVDIWVYDQDNQRGIYSPTSVEEESLKHALTRTSDNTMSNITFGTDAKEQILIDIARSGIDGVRQYFSKKLGITVVKIPANYKLKLKPNNE